MRTIRPLPPVCRALLAVEHDWPALRKVIANYAEFEAEPPMPGLGLPERQRSVLWAYMRECEGVPAYPGYRLSEEERGAK